MKITIETNDLNIIGAIGNLLRDLNYNPPGSASTPPSHTQTAPAPSQPQGGGQPVGSEAARPAYVKPWHETVIHFGKMKGTKLGDLSPANLQWYRDKWHPGSNPNYPASAEDTALKRAVEIGLNSFNQVDPASPDGLDDNIPF